MTPARRSFKAPFSRPQLRALADDQSYKRGQRYAADGRVGDIADNDGHISATVHGTMRYRTGLRFAGSRVTWECTCPVGDDGSCCKHCVALGLTWLERSAIGDGSETATTGAGAPRKRAAVKKVAGRPLTMKDIRAHLSSLPLDALVNLLITRAMQDEQLHQQLLLSTTKSVAGGVNINAWRRTLTAAMETGEYVHYREASGYFSQIEEVLAAIAEITIAHPDAVIELVEHALELMERAIQHVDDSDGGGSEVLERLQRMHLAACIRARPDPEALARRLFAWEMRSECDIFSGAHTRYARVFGKKGSSVYRALADAAWAKTPALHAGHHDRSFAGNRSRITAIMEALATQAGDIDAIADIRARDLSHAYSYLCIAELYHGAKRHSDAIMWAERGMAAFPDRTDRRLRSFLAAEYQQHGRADEALALLWHNFTDHLCLEHYVALHAVAHAAGVWSTFRVRAIAAVRKHVSVRSGAVARGYAPLPRDGTLLIEILLWEENVEEAWQVAEASGCRDDMLMRLAELRETSHPADAVRVYQASVERTLAQKNSQAYQDTVKQLKVIARVMKRAVPLSASNGSFRAYLEAVRVRHKPKRNFMKLLDAARF
ncbi:SWIM zinc finger domain-containing protein [Gemmatimonas sp.]|uniref:SWIM zinc finger family protein n=1 Tax=Gemmatimonas sp. TaxID=1962908 RepID=UPI0039836E21